MTRFGAGHVAQIGRRRTHASSDRGLQSTAARSSHAVASVAARLARVLGHGRCARVAAEGPAGAGWRALPCPRPAAAARSRRHRRILRRPQRRSRQHRPAPGGRPGDHRWGMTSRSGPAGSSVPPGGRSSARAGRTVARLRAWRSATRRLHCHDSSAREPSMSAAASTIAPSTGIARRVARDQVAWLELADRRRLGASSRLPDCRTGAEHLADVTHRDSLAGMTTRVRTGFSAGSRSGANAPWSRWCAVGFAASMTAKEVTPNAELDRLCGRWLPAVSLGRPGGCPARPHAESQTHPRLRDRGPTHVPLRRPPAEGAPAPARDRGRARTARGRRRGPPRRTRPT